MTVLLSKESGSRAIRAAVGVPQVEPIWNWKLVNPAAIKLDKSS